MCVQGDTPGNTGPDLVQTKLSLEPSSEEPSFSGTVPHHARFRVAQARSACSWVAEGRESQWFAKLVLTVWVVPKKLRVLQGRSGACGVAHMLSGLLDPLQTQLLPELMWPCDCPILSTPEFLNSDWTQTLLHVRFLLFDPLFLWASGSRL
jgi:hypothetical protein